MYFKFILLFSFCFTPQYICLLIKLVISLSKHSNLFPHCLSILCKLLLQMPEQRRVVLNKRESRHSLPLKDFLILY